MPDKLYTAVEAAKVLSVSRQTINRLRAEGRIPEGKGCIVISSNLIRYRAEYIDGVAAGKIKMGMDVQNA